MKKVWKILEYIFETSLESLENSQEFKKVNFN